MKFLVFIKQVPASSDIRFDLNKKTLIREGVKNEINAYDRRAITEAIRYRNERGGQVVVVTMGPASAVDAMKEAVFMGADECIHIQDPRLAGSDTLVTAHVLATAARKIGYDIIFCGQHSTDAETGQVPVELAELLGIPCATAVYKIEYLPDRLIQVTSETDEGSILLEMPLPAVLTAAERLIRPLKTKNADLSAVTLEKIHSWTLDDLGIHANEVGLEASPTRVADIKDTRVTRTPELISGSDVLAAANAILNLIRDQTIHNQPSANQRSIERPCSVMDGGRAYWCWIEFVQDHPRSVSLEILSAARSLAAAQRGSVHAILAHNLTEQTVDMLASFGANRICHIDAPGFHPDEIVTLLEKKIQEEQPFALFFPATSEGKYLAPRIAGRLRLGLTGDCVGLELSSEGKLAQLKPAFGGNIVAPIYSRTEPQMATIRPGCLNVLPSNATTSPEVVRWPAPAGTQKQFTIIAKQIDPGIDAMKLDQATIVVGIGAGLGQENITLAERLAELLGGAVGATRKVVDNGWMPRQFQIGLTGKFISPRVYLSLGVGGRYNHMIGVQKSNRIIAINQDPNAEIFRMCDIGIEGDCVAIAREMIRILES